MQCCEVHSIHTIAATVALITITIMCLGLGKIFNTLIVLLVKDCKKITRLLVRVVRYPVTVTDSESCLIRGNYSLIALSVCNHYE